MAVIYPLQRSIPPRRRRADWVGKPRIKLAERMDAALQDLGYESKIEPDKIYPAQGYWRNRADVVRIEGILNIKSNDKWTKRRLSSWSTISDLLRHGFDIEVTPLCVELYCRSGRPDTPAGC